MTQPPGIVCSRCNTHIPGDAKFCPNCGLSFSAPPPQSYYHQPPPQPQIVYVQQPAAPKRTNVIGILLLTIVVLCGGIYLFQYKPTSRSSLAPFVNPPNTTSKITYKISGTPGRAGLTYQNGDGSTQQEEVSIPWQKVITVKTQGFLYISAQNQQDHGSVTCEILVDGISFKTATSSGAYKIASCDGSAP